MASNVPIAKANVNSGLKLSWVALDLSSPTASSKIHEPRQNSVGFTSYAAVHEAQRHNVGSCVPFRTGRYATAGGRGGHDAEHAAPVRCVAEEDQPAC